ncbi:hypothetical protein LR48_Vigan11g128600 [Vigna angularis]|uniref:Uncharacterized protein n=1 Tax=Phaseolus angularis TaxID=3914 RepID=A0A0L9VTR0_PHAAN|nr:hypothetical protein LR48_Vigan11g128600 [Vigna angularis]
MKVVVSESGSGPDLERICGGSGADLDDAGVVDHTTARQQRGGHGGEGTAAGWHEQWLDDSRREEFLGWQQREEKQREERVDERELDDEAVVGHATATQQRGGRENEGAAAGRREQWLDGSRERRISSMAAERREAQI